MNTMTTHNCPSCQCKEPGYRDNALTITESVYLSSEQVGKGILIRIPKPAPKHICQCPGFLMRLIHRIGYKDKWQCNSCGTMWKLFGSDKDIGLATWCQVGVDCE